MTIPLNITKEQIADQLCTALEGGSNYWHMLGDVDRIYFDKSLTLVDNLVRSFLADKEYELNVYDIESDEDEPDLLGKVTYKSIGNAFTLMGAHYPKQLANIISGDYDADDSDVWFQLATMGEVVYG
jgi:hypothetical protein